MNRSKLITVLIEKNQFLSKNDAEDSVSLILESISNALAQQGRVELRGFGSFSTRKRNKRPNRLNPVKILQMQSKTIKTIKFQ